MRRSVVIAGGRRIDPAIGAASRFPPNSEDRVAVEIGKGLSSVAASEIFCSAACGADILVLEAAQRLRIPVRVILPFPPEIFRTLSVADCDGVWASRYDDLLHRLSAAPGTLRILNSNSPVSEGEAAAGYHAVTNALVEEAIQTVGQRSDATGSGLIIWDGVRKSANDETADLRERILENGWNVLEVLTVQS